MDSSTIAEAVREGWQLTVTHVTGIEFRDVVITDWNIALVTLQTEVDGTYIVPWSNVAYVQVKVGAARA